MSTLGAVIGELEPGAEGWAHVEKAAGGYDNQYAVYDGNNTILNHFKLSENRTIEGESTRTLKSCLKNKTAELTIEVDKTDRFCSCFGSFRKTKK